MRILVEAEVTGYHKKYKGTTQTYFIIKPCECVCARELLRRVALAKKESSNHCGVKRCFWSLIKSMWTRRNTWRQREQSLFGLFVKIFPPSSMQRAVRGLALFNGCLHAYKSPSSIFWATCAVSSSEIRALCAQLFHPQGCRGFLRLISVTIDCSKNVRKSSVRITQR